MSTDHVQHLHTHLVKGEPEAGDSYHRHVLITWELCNFSNTADMVPGQCVSSPVYHSPEDPDTRWSLELFPTGRFPFFKDWIALHLRCHSLSEECGDVVLVQMLVSCEEMLETFVSSLRPGNTNGPDRLMQREAAGRQDGRLLLTVQLRWSSLQLPMEVLQPASTQRLLTELAADGNQIHLQQSFVMAEWLVVNFSSLPRQQGRTVTSPLFGSSGVCWLMELFADGCQCTPSSTLAVVLKLVHLPTEHRTHGLRVRYRICSSASEYENWSEKSFVEGSSVGFGFGSRDQYPHHDLRIRVELGCLSGVYCSETGDS